VKKDPLKRAWFRKGMVVVEGNSHPKPSWCFRAEVVILHHATTIREQYQAVIHCGVIRQSAQVVEMSEELLRAGDRSIILFRFLYTAEFLKEGETILFREGRTKGIGKIVAVLDDVS